MSCACLRVGVMAIAIASCLASAAQPARTWVFLRDKPAADSAEAVAEARATLTDRAIARRALRGDVGGIVWYDLPVSPDYITAIDAAGGEPHIVSRWLNAVSVTATAEQIRQIEQLPFVARTQPVARGQVPEPIVSRKRTARPAPSSNRMIDHGLATEQLDQINVIALHDAGFTGAGIVVGILDTGFRTTHDVFNSPGNPIDVIAAWDFVGDNAIVDTEPGETSSVHWHGTLILSNIGGNDPGNYVGGAPDASFILCRTEDIDDEYPGEEDNYVAGLEFAELNGADMVTSSLGYIDWYTQADLDGVTAVTTIAVNIANSLGLHVTTAAGNEGNDGDPLTSSLIAPADALGVITVGAVDSGNVPAWFTSTGPTADGRVKPEIVARGIDTISADPFVDDAFIGVSGTSLSTPLLAAAVACLTQAHPDWTPAEMRARVMSSGDTFRDTGTFDPLMLRGFGLLDAAYVLADDCNDNGIADSVEIDAGTVADCNGNGLPDSCDIALGIEADLNGDGVPDSCPVDPCSPIDLAEPFGELDFFDVDAFLLAFAAGDPIVDLNADGVIDFFDVSEFLVLFAAGCP